jgi:hypothetical protein
MTIVTGTNPALLQGGKKKKKSPKKVLSKIKGLNIIDTGDGWNEKTINIKSLGKSKKSKK